MSKKRNMIGKRLFCLRDANGKTYRVKKKGVLFFSNKESARRTRKLINPTEVVKSEKGKEVPQEVLQWHISLGPDHRRVAQ